MLALFYFPAATPTHKSAAVRRYGLGLILLGIGSYRFYPVTKYHNLENSVDHKSSG